MLGTLFRWLIEQRYVLANPFAGIKVRGRIRQVNGRNVDSVEDARRSIYGAGVGDRLTLKVERGDQAMNVTLILAEAPEDQR